MKLSRDLLAGLMFSAIGGTALFIARNYVFGSTLSMGPGYFPTIIAVLVLTFGLVITAREVWVATGPSVESFRVRPLLLISAAIVGCALLIDSAGMIPAVICLVVVGWYANPLRRWCELPFLLAGGIVLPILIFRIGLNMPIRLWVM